MIEDDGWSGDNGRWRVLKEGGTDRERERERIIGDDYGGRFLKKCVLYRINSL